MSDTCRLCGRVFYEASFGGPGVCPACDCGVTNPAVLQQHIARLLEKNDALAAKLAEARRLLEDVVDCVDQLNISDEIRAFLAAADKGDAAHE